MLSDTTKVMLLTMSNVAKRTPDVNDKIVDSIQDVCIRDFVHPNAC